MPDTNNQPRPDILMIRAEIKPEHAADVEAAVTKMFAAIEREELEGIRYTSARLPDGTTYVVMLEIQDGVENPLPALPEFGEFQAALQQWTAAPPKPEPLTVVGSYRSF